MAWGCLADTLQDEATESRRLSLVTKGEQLSFGLPLVRWQEEPAGERPYDPADALDGAASSSSVPVHRGPTDSGVRESESLADFVWSLTDGSRCFSCGKAALQAGRESSLTCPVCGAGVVNQEAA